MHTHTHKKKIIYKIHRFLKFISETGNCEDQSPTRSSTAGTGSCEKKAWGGEERNIEGTTEVCKAILNFRISLHIAVVSFVIYSLIIDQTSKE